MTYSNANASMFVYLFVMRSGVKKISKVHWSRTSEHQESTGPEKLTKLMDF
jgi:hypothetical protein